MIGLTSSNTFRELTLVGQIDAALLIAYAFMLALGGWIIDFGRARHFGELTIEERYPDRVVTYVATVCVGGGT